MYYMRVQRALGKDIEFRGTIGQCIKYLLLNFPLDYQGHFILKVL